MDPDLRSAKTGGGVAWTETQIKTGFLKFYSMNQRFPTAHEIDTFEFLPSSRSLQRSYGGLVNIRTRLFPEEIANFTSGEYRQKIASDTFKRSQAYEEAFHKKLCTYLEEISVHEHKIVRPGNVTSDFFIYLKPDAGICVDLFYAKDIFSVAGVINIKIKRYKKLECPVLFVLLHDGSLDQTKITQLVANRTNPVPAHIRIVTEDYFWSDLILEIKEKSLYCINSS